MNDKASNAERLTAALTLSAVGGFLDVYTYLYRGRVFANAVTGNMVLFGLNLAELNYGAGVKYLLAIASYALGILIAETLRRKLPESRRISWHQSVILLEFVCLTAVVFIPYGDFDFLVNAMISMVCAMQVQTFRRVRGLPFSSTMCTGNLRSGTEALFRGLTGSGPAEFHKAQHYYWVICCFVGGAAAGAVLLRKFGHYVFLIAPLGMAAVFFLIANQREWALWRRSWRRMFGR